MSGTELKRRDLSLVSFPLEVKDKLLSLVCFHSLKIFHGGRTIIGRHQTNILTYVPTIYAVPRVIAVSPGQFCSDRGKHEEEGPSDDDVVVERHVKRH